MTPATSSTGILQDLFDLLAHPERGLRRGLEEPSVGLAALILILSQVSSSLGIYLIAGVPGSAAISMILDVGFALALSVGLILSGAAFFSLYLSMMGGRGDGTRLLFALVLGEAPWILATPLVLVALAVRLLSPGFYLLALMGVFMGLWAASFIWKVHGMAIAYQVDVARAAFAYLAGYGTALLLFWFVMTSGWLWMVNRLVAIAR